MTTPKKWHWPHSRIGVARRVAPVPGEPHSARFDVRWGFAGRVDLPENSGMGPILFRPVMGPPEEWVRHKIRFAENYVMRPLPIVVFDTGNLLCHRFYRHFPQIVPPRHRLYRHNLCIAFIKFD